MRILMTGATGFLGQRLVRRLALRHTVFAVCRNTSAALPTGASPIALDLSLPLDSAALPAQIDAVVHLAQSPHYRDFPAAARHVASTNLGSTTALLDYARSAGAQHFVLASSGAVYGDSAGPMVEDVPLVPRGYYAVTKYAAELLANEYASMMSVCVLRCFFIYGAGQQPDRLVPSLLERVRSGSPIFLDGHSNGMIFAPTHVDDVAAVFARSLDERWTGTLNLASNARIDLRSFVGILGEKLGKPPSFQIRDDRQRMVYEPVLDRLAARFDIDSFLGPREGIDEVLR